VLIQEALVDGDEEIDYNEQYLRVIEFSEADVNIHFYKPDKGEEVLMPVDQMDEHAPDMHFLYRIFVLTNEGFVILRRITKEFRCKKCEPKAFCPRGPLVQLKVEYKEIETIFSFPQIPQKVVLLVNKEC